MEEKDEEEVWKELTLSSSSASTPPLSLHWHHHFPADTAGAATYAKATCLQDFLSRAFAEEAAVPPATPASHHRPPTFGVGLSPTAAVDLRGKRMIKNRESAARSRARKQAYRQELEKEVAKLLEENRELKNKHEELLKQTTATQLPLAKKWKLIQRTASALF